MYLVFQILEACLEAPENSVVSDMTLFDALHVVASAFQSADSQKTVSACTTVSCSTCFLMIGFLFADYRHSSSSYLALPPPPAIVSCHVDVAIHDSGS